MRVPLQVSGWLIVFLSVQIASLAPCHAQEHADPQTVAQVISADGEVVFASTHDRLMRDAGERRAMHLPPAPQSILKAGQWLRAGEAVMAYEHASARLRWRDGGEQQLGPRDIPTETTIRPLHVVAVAAPPASAASIALRETAQPLRTFERMHRPWLLFALGSILALLPLLRRRPYRPGFGARLVAGALFACLTLPVSLLLLAAQLGRMAWYVPPIPGQSWTGIAATVAHAANIAAFIGVFAGLLALCRLSIAFIRGGGERLSRCHSRWWTLAFGALAITTASYLAAYAPNVDFDSQWYHFWQGWQRYYVQGAWLLLPFAHLVACARTEPVAHAPHARWQGLAASALAIVFVACYALGFDAEYDPIIGTRASEPASRAEARRLLCATPNIFEGTPANPRVVSEPGCTPPQPRAAGDTSGLLQRCEALLVDVRVDEVLRSADLKPGQSVVFAVAHARMQLDGDNGLVASLAGSLLFKTRDDVVAGQHVQVSAARNGSVRLSPLGFNNALDAAYAASVLAECEHPPQ